MTHHVSRPDPIEVTAATWRWRCSVQVDGNTRCSAEGYATTQGAALRAQAAWAELYQSDEMWALFNEVGNG